MSAARRRFPQRMIFLSKIVFCLQYAAQESCPLSGCVAQSTRLQHGGSKFKESSRQPLGVRSVEDPCHDDLE